MRKAHPLPLVVAGRPQLGKTIQIDQGTASTIEPTNSVNASSRAVAQKTTAIQELATASIPYSRYEISDPSGAPFRTQGKLFFTGGDGLGYQCSATAVTSDNESVVWTAGHCAHDEFGWSEDIQFVPGYKNGVAPYGEWAVVEGLVASSWASYQNLSYDLAGLVVETRGGERLTDVVGSRGIMFNASRNQSFESFGYPAAWPFDGRRLYACTSQYGGDDSRFDASNPTMAIGCDMTGGSSGGGWIIQDQYLNSTNSYGYLGEPEVMYGPYFGTAAQNIYTAASASTVPGPLPSPAPTATPTATPTASPSPTPEPEQYHPSWLLIHGGRRVAGSARSLRSRDGVNLVIQSTLRRGRYGLDYDLLADVPGDGNTSPASIDLDLVTSNSTRMRVWVWDASSEKWRDLGARSVAPSSPLHLDLRRASRYVDSDGAIAFGFTGKSRAGFRHKIDFMRLTLE